MDQGPRVPGPNEVGWIFWLRQCLSFDIRSLALMRILVGAVVILDLLCCWSHVPLLLTDQGVYPRELLLRSRPWTFIPSIYMLCGSIETTYTFYMVHLLAAVALMLGYKTRWSSLLCFVFTVSVQMRNPWIVLGADQMIRLVLFYGIFLPWGEVWSFDECAESQAGSVPAGQVCTPMVASWKIQLALVYLAAGLAKRGLCWDDGTAIEMALQADGYSREFGLAVLNWAQQFDGLLAALTFLVGPAEALLGLLLITPWRRTQQLGFWGLVLMHIVFNSCLSLGRFGLLSVSVLSCFYLFKPKPQRVDRWQWPWGETFLGLSLVLIAAISNLNALGGKWKQSFPQLRTGLGELGLQQSWLMFVPPPNEGGYTAILARTFQGRWLNLLAPEPREFDSWQEAGIWDASVADYYQSRQRHLFFDRTTRSGQGDASSWDAELRGMVRLWEMNHREWNQRIVEAHLVRYYRTYQPGKGYSPMQSYNVRQMRFD